MSKKKELLSGSGTPLGDIPSVMEHLKAVSRAAPELQLAHRLCFGTTCKPTRVKEQVRRVWVWVWVWVWV